MIQTRIYPAILIKVMEYKLVLFVLVQKKFIWTPIWTGHLLGW